MRFDLLQDGAIAAGPCAAGACRRWVAATGAITADTPRDFLAFAEGKNLRGLTIALDSDGGSVLGALALGRAIRSLEMTTTVGRALPSDAGSGRLDPQADCESMCAFVLLAGVRRQVPDEAGILVHQIWIGDRRDDPTAATYSAEDLVLVQRDIGRIAQYLAEVGASPEILDLALRIPPWEPMRRLTGEELRRLRIVTAGGPLAHADVSTAGTQAASPLPVIPASVSAADGQRLWQFLDGVGGAALTRRHPLTVEGEEIGMFDVTFACGPGAGRYLVSYSEWRNTDGATPRAPAAKVTVSIGRVAVPLTVAASASAASAGSLFASATVAQETVAAFASTPGRSLTVATAGLGSGAGAGATSIRIGNTGFARNLPQLAARCDAMAARDTKHETQQQAKVPTKRQAKPGTLVEAGSITRN